MGLKLNLACGVNVKPGWVNVDLYREGVDVERIDLTKPWPWADESAEVVYCEHFLEHLEWPDEAGFFVREAWRVLKTQGEFHIGVPDVKRMCRWAASLFDDRDFDIDREMYKWGNPLSADRMDTFQYHMRMNGEHKWGYSESSLDRLLDKNGSWARLPRRRAFDPNMDSPVRAIGTLYLCATRLPEMP